MSGFELSGNVFEAARMLAVDARGGARRTDGPLAQPVIAKTDPSKIKAKKSDDGWNLFLVDMHKRYASNPPCAMGCNPYQSAP
jgi:hypothetical protein